MAKAKKKSKLAGKANLPVKYSWAFRRFEKAMKQDGFEIENVEVLSGEGITPRSRYSFTVKSLPNWRGVLVLNAPDEETVLGTIAFSYDCGACSPYDNTYMYTFYDDFEASTTSLYATTNQMLYYIRRYPELAFCQDVLDWDLHISYLPRWRAKLLMYKYLRNLKKVESVNVQSN